MIPTALEADCFCASPNAVRDAVLRCWSGVSPRQNPAPDQQSSISCCIASGEERSESKAKPLSYKLTMIAAKKQIEAHSTMPCQIAFWNRIPGCEYTSVPAE